MSKIRNKIGIMNGRLSEPISRKIQEFPKNSWKYEFEKASVCGFELIEWIFDIYDKNLIMNNDGIKEIKHISEKTGIIINSVLADFFMEKKLFNVSEFDLQKNLEVENMLKNEVALQRFGKPEDLAIARARLTENKRRKYESVLKN